MFFKIKLLKFNEDTYINIKGVDSKRKHNKIILFAEVDKKEIYKKIINFSKDNEEITLEFPKISSEYVWFYYIFNGKSCYIDKFNEADIELIDSKYISHFFYSIAKKEILNKLNGRC